MSLCNTRDQGEVPARSKPNTESVRVDRQISRHREELQNQQLRGIGNHWPISGILVGQDRAEGPGQQGDETTDPLEHYRSSHTTLPTDELGNNQLPASADHTDSATKQVPPSKASKGKHKSGRQWFITTRQVIEMAALAALIFLLVRASFQNFRVEGSSMAPSLESGQHLIVNKLAYTTIDLQIFEWAPFFDPDEDSVHHLFGSPSQGDVIVFQSPQDSEQDFIKRIIGVPGDSVEIRTSNVFLNGRQLEEPYTQGNTGGCTTPCRWEVPTNNYFVLGDNRTGSSDSRMFGFVPEKSVIGKALFSYWPLKEAGLAPNRSISLASEE